jgi:hypothetical protein
MQPWEAGLSAMAAAPRCQAHTRQKASCLSPTVKGQRVCRMHGGKGSGAPKGVANGAWEHGGWTKEAVRVRRAAAALLRALKAT